jgi:hypothetical protein
MSFSFLRDRDNRELFEKRNRAATKQVWQNRLEAMEWSYVVEKVDADGTYRFGTLWEIIGLVLEDEDNFRDVFNKAVPSAPDMVYQMIQEVCQSHGLKASMGSDDRVMIARPEADPETVVETNVTDTQTPS